MSVCPSEAHAYLFQEVANLERWITAFAPHRKWGKVSSAVAESVHAIFDDAERALPPPAFLEAVLLRWQRLLHRRLLHVRTEVAKAREQEDRVRRAKRFVLPWEEELTKRAQLWLEDESKVGPLLLCVACIHTAV